MFSLYWVRCPMCPCQGLPASTEETSDCLLITSIHLPLCFDRHFLSFSFGLSFQTLKHLWNINVFISCLHFLSVGHVEMWHRFHLNHDLCEGKDTCSCYTKFCTSMETKAWNCEQKFGSTKPTHVYTELKGRTLQRLWWHNNDEFMSGKNLASISEGEDMRKELLKKQQTSVMNSKTTASLSAHWGHLCKNLNIQNNTVIIMLKTIQLCWTAPTLKTFQSKL